MPMMAVPTIEALGVPLANARRDGLCAAGAADDRIRAIDTTNLAGEEAAALRPRL